jgi:[ribosomal protein S18]-alanine N-acetyltransferase
MQEYQRLSMHISPGLFGNHRGRGLLRLQYYLTRSWLNPLGFCGSKAYFSCEYAVSCCLSPASRYNTAVSYRLRPFKPTDFETLWHIDQDCFDPQLAYSRPELAWYMRRPGSFTIVAERESDASIQGFIVAETRRKTGHIITIDVIADARRTGLGSELLHAAEQKLMMAGVATVALETPVNNDAAIRFYKRHGYFVEKTVAGYYSGQLDALVMSKELGKPQPVST